MKFVVVGILAVVFVLIGLQLQASVPVPEEMLVLPVRVHMVIEQSGFYATERDGDSVLRLMAQANRIWEPAGIQFYVVGVEDAPVTADAIPRALNGNYEQLTALNSYTYRELHLFLVQSLNGINGLAILQENAILVADYTTVNDYRTTAHEFGHLLGLRHVEPVTSLMARGKNGELLSANEIALARDVATRFLTAT